MPRRFRTRVSTLRRFCLTMLLVAVISTSGCGTVISFVLSKGDVPPPYAGVYVDVGILSDQYSNDYSLWPLLAAGLVLDMPITFAADTLLLFVTLPVYLGK